MPRDHANEGLRVPQVLVLSDFQEVFQARLHLSFPVSPRDDGNILDSGYVHDLLFSGSLSRLVKENGWNQLTIQKIRDRLLDDAEYMIDGCYHAQAIPMIPHFMTWSLQALQVGDPFIDVLMRFLSEEKTILTVKEPIGAIKLLSTISQISCIIDFMVFVKEFDQYTFSARPSFDVVLKNWSSLIPLAWERR